jgi:hypothetical protein
MVTPICVNASRELYLYTITVGAINYPRFGNSDIACKIPLSWSILCRPTRGCAEILSFSTAASSRELITGTVENTTKSLPQVCIVGFVCLVIGDNGSQLLVQRTRPSCGTQTLELVRSCLGVELSLQITNLCSSWSTACCT